jgi:hypothetical protein
VIGDRDRSPAGPIGFRLANELEGLLEGISADGVITSAETERVRRWLEANVQFTAVHPFHELEERLTQVLADGVVTMEECADLLWVVRKYTKTNPYFDQLRGGLQILSGLLTGVAADGVLGDHEIAALTAWTEEWEHLRGLWPYDEVDAMVSSILAQRHVGAAIPYLLELARQFPIAGAEDSPPLLVRSVCAIEPVIRFRGQTFVFTGESTQCERKVLHSLAAERGGRFTEQVTAETDYLVVCDGGRPYWAFACYGRKVEEAHAMRREGHPLIIVHEADFWDAVASTTTRCQ